jgi:hypothetical protein
MAKGGSQQARPYVPEFAETGMQQIVGTGQDLAPLMSTYTPDYGPQVASLSPQEQLAQQYTDMSANAFGMPTVDASSYLPQAQSYGGIQGYSSRPMTEQMIGQYKAERPTQAAYTESFGLDPVTGEVGSRAPQNQPVSLEMQGSGGGK